MVVTLQRRAEKHEFGYIRIKKSRPRRPVLNI